MCPSYEHIYISNYELILLKELRNDLPAHFLRLVRPSYVFSYSYKQFQYSHNVLSHYASMVRRLMRRGHTNKPKLLLA